MRIAGPPHHRMRFGSTHQERSRPEAVAAGGTSRASGRPLRLGMLTGCAVPYKAPVYRGLAETAGLDFTAIFASRAGIRPSDLGYSQNVAWDADLLAGYRSIFLRGGDKSPALGSSYWSVRDPDIVSVLARARFDVLWLDGYNSLTYSLAIFTQTMLRRPLLFREEQTLLHPRPLGVTLAKEVALRALLRGRHALYISTENRRWFEHYGVAPERLWSAPYSVDNAFFQSEAQRLRSRRAALREYFGIDPDAGPVILSVGRLIEKKQPEFALEVFRRLRAKHRCAMLFVGSGPLEEPLRNIVAQHHVPDVHFAGFLNQTEVSQAYACADVFTLLSREHETFGVVVAEAMNFGLPVVVTDKVGCHADLVLREHNGFVVSVVEPESAVEALERLVGDAALRARMGRASRERVDDWTPRRTIAGIIDACRAVAGEGVEFAALAH